MTLRQLLLERREELLRRFVERVREAPFDTDRLPSVVLLNGLPRFLDHVALAMVRHEDPGDAIGQSSTTPLAQLHGLQRLEIGFDVAEVVREYGILRDVVLELMIEHGVRDLEEYKIFARHLSAGCADAVAHFAAEEERRRQQLAAQHQAFLAHELRNKLAGALAAVSWWKRTQAAGELAVRTLGETLGELTELVDREVTSARLDGVRAGLTLRRERVAVSDLLFAAARDVRGQAEARAISVRVSADPGLSLEIDPRLLRSALANLVGNAIKFTRQGGGVELRALEREGVEIHLEVEDECGGLPEGAIDHLFQPFVQLSRDRTGFGLGLSIARQAVEAHGGRLTVEDRPGKGCVFRIELSGLQAVSRSAG
jgi:signal transduction histidine kinase